MLQSTNLSRFLLGNLITKSSLPDLKPLKMREYILKGEDRTRFLRMMDKMLRWEPSERSSAHELVEDEWIHN
jgi:serine/threonine-protein kinase SRPK3